MVLADLANVVNISPEFMQMIQRFAGQANDVLQTAASKAAEVFANLVENNPQIVQFLQRNSIHILQAIGFITVFPYVLTAAVGVGVFAFSLLPVYIGRTLGGIARILFRDMPQQINEILKVNVDNLRTAYGITNTLYYGALLILGGPIQIPLNIVYNLAKVVLVPLIVIPSVIQKSYAYAVSAAKSVYNSTPISFIRLPFALASNPQNLNRPFVRRGAPPVNAPVSTNDLANELSTVSRRLDILSYNSNTNFNELKECIGYSSNQPLQRSISGINKRLNGLQQSTDSALGILENINGGAGISELDRKAEKLQTTLGEFETNMQRSFDATEKNIIANIHSRHNGSAAAQSESQARAVTFAFPHVVNDSAEQTLEGPAQQIAAMNDAEGKNLASEEDAERVKQAEFKYRT